MHNIALTWQQAAAVAAVLLAVALLLRMSDRPGARRAAPFAVESCLIAGLYSLWQLAGSLSVLGMSGAFRRAGDIVQWEHDWHLPSEATVQRQVIGHPLIVQASNVYYASMHFGAIFVFLVWLFVRHRDRYPSVRTTLAWTTLVCLLIQLVPVAPPRLLPSFVDTATTYGQSVYSLGLAPDQLSAMPSVHVAWAVLVGWAVIRISTSPWRWWVLAHPVLTVFVVVATANHFWLDGIVAVAVLIACALAQRGARGVVHAVRRPAVGSDVLSDAAISPMLR